MAQPGFISLPRTRVVPVGMVAAHRAKVIAIVTAVLCAIFLILGGADVVTDSQRPERNDMAALFWVVVCGFYCALAVWRAKRVIATARRAAADVGSTWMLAGKLIVATDDRGDPMPEHSFKVTRAQRALLLSAETKAVESHVTVPSAT